jgi:hypothetical protein
LLTGGQEWVSVQRNKPQSQCRVPRNSSNARELLHCSLLRRNHPRQLPSSLSHCVAGLAEHSPPDDNLSCLPAELTVPCPPSHLPRSVSLDLRVPAFRRELSNQPRTPGGLKLDGALWLDGPGGTILVIRGCRFSSVMEPGATAHRTRRGHTCNHQLDLSPL